MWAGAFGRPLVPAHVIDEVPTAMRIVLLCATDRGHRVLQELAAIVPDAELTVVTFREEPEEPPFLDIIRETTLDRGGEFYEAARSGADGARATWEAQPFDLLLAVSWRYLVPPGIYERASIGAFVFHDSLLPAYRGFSPTVWAIVNGDDHTGVTLFEMATDIDSGDIVAQERVPIGPDETIADVLEHVTQAYLRILKANLPVLIAGNWPRISQDHSLATYTRKRRSEDNIIDWSAPTERIYNLIRGVTSPYPGATATLGGRALRIWSAERLSDPTRYAGGVVGQVVEVSQGRGSIVRTGDGALLVTKVGFEGGAPFRADDVLHEKGRLLGRGSD